MEIPPKHNIYPGVVDSGQLGFWSLEHEESGQVGSVRGDDDHGESGPHHSQHPGAETPRCSFPNAAVEKHSPRKPNCARQIESVLLGAIRVSQFETTKRGESVTDFFYISNIIAKCLISGKNPLGKECSHEKLIKNYF
jgi:hypothetical protein